jgi:thiamine kinase-like enzyme
MPADASTIDLPELLASIAEPALREAKPVAQLSGGPVSCSWQLDSALGPVVLRLDLPMAAKLQLDREAEVIALRDRALAGIGPELLWADVERGLLVTRLLSGRVWLAEDIAQPNNLLRLGRLLGRLHSMPVQHKSQDLGLTLAIYAELLNTAKARSISLSAQKLLAELSVAGENNVFCHRDVHSGNIVDTGELRLIDWEYAGSADPCVDLAVVAQQHRLATRQLNCLLEGYGESLQPLDRGRLRQFCRLYDYLASLWYMLARNEPMQAGWGLTIPAHYLD